jgi:hypothetical protein
VEKGGKKKYIKERNGRSSWERQGIVAFCTCQWNEWSDMHEPHCGYPFYMKWNQRTTGKQRIGKDLKGCSHGLTEVLSQHLTRRSKERNEKPSLNTDHVPVEMWTRHLPNKVMSINYDTNRFDHKIIQYQAKCSLAQTSNTQFPKNNIYGPLSLVLSCWRLECTKQICQLFCTCVKHRLLQWKISINYCVLKYSAQENIWILNTMKSAI